MSTKQEISKGCRVQRNQVKELEHTASQDRMVFHNNKRYDLQGNKSASLFTGRVYVPVLVLTVTTRTSLSLPACVLMTFAIGHRVGTIPFSRRTTMSPTTMFLEGRHHLWNFCRLTRYSEDHRCQKCLTRDWHRSHCCRSEKERNETAGFGRA